MEAVADRKDETPGDIARREAREGPKRAAREARASEMKKEHRIRSFVLSYARTMDTRATAAEFGVSRRRAREIIDSAEGKRMLAEHFESRVATMENATPKWVIEGLMAMAEDRTVAGPARVRAFQLVGLTAGLFGGEPGSGAPTTLESLPTAELLGVIRTAFEHRGERVFEKTIDVTPPGSERPVSMATRVRELPSGVKAGEEE